MSRRLILFFATAALGLSAAILPEQFGNWKRESVSVALTPADTELWNEFGFQAGERAGYSAAGQSILLSAWRFADTTGAFAAWQAEATASTGRKGLVHRANYLLRVENGPVPDPLALEDLTSRMPGRASSAMPPLFGHLPRKGRVPESERYALGPAGLARFEARVPREVASFDRGAEAQTARYRLNKNSEFQLTIFSYPTPQFAIERFRQFEKLQRAALKRSGVLIAIIPEAKQDPEAAKLLEEINYRPNVSWNEFAPIHSTQDAAKMILAISVLATGLIVASLILGLCFGGGKILARHFGLRSDEDDFTSLHLR